MSGQWINLGHVCEKPSQAERKEVGAKLGAVWKCECGQLWELSDKTGYGGTCAIRWIDAGSIREEDTDD